MAGHEAVNTHGRTRLSFANEADIDEFVVMLEKYERGEITPDQWRTFRLLRGTYGQRQDGVQMLRIKVPQGIATARQLRAMGDVAPSYRPGVVPSDLAPLLPDYAIAAIREAIPAFARSLPGYDLPDAVLTGVETRTSSPVRVRRGPDGQSVNTRGLFPAGEGAG